MRFMYCLNMVFNLTFLHDVKWESVAALTHHFAHAFVRENVAPVYDALVT